MIKYEWKYKELMRFASYLVDIEEHKVMRFERGLKVDIIRVIKI